MDVDQFNPPLSVCLQRASNDSVNTVRSALQVMVNGVQAEEPFVQSEEPFVQSDQAMRQQILAVCAKNSPSSPADCSDLEDDEDDVSEWSQLTQSHQHSHKTIRVLCSKQGPPQMANNHQEDQLSAGGSSDPSALLSGAGAIESQDCVYHHDNQASSQSSAHQQPLLNGRAIRIGSSCISVNSTLSHTSNDSSLLDYPANTPICKFCHQRSKPNNPLISPCHCKGTIRFMHARCLMKWLDKLKRRNSRSQPLSCEICNYEYRWRKQFKSPIEWTLPPCIGNDRQWHTIFVICALLMVISMINLVIFGDDDHHHYHKLGHHNARKKIWNNKNPLVNNSHNELIGSSIADPSINPFSSSNVSSSADNNHQVFLLPTAGFSTINALLQNISIQEDAMPSNDSILASNQYLAKKDHMSNSPPFDLDIGNSETNANKANLNPLFVTTDPWRRRKSYPTKPHEVILVISGCLFFISFFLGTFAQIKSEISFYNMFMRFIHYNQQWIIEEYDPDDSHNNTKCNDCIPNNETATTEATVSIAPTQTPSMYISEATQLTIDKPAEFVV